MDPRIVSRSDILDASKVVIRNGCMPHRIVLRKLEREFVVHNEYMTTEAPTDGSACRLVHHSFENGDYFLFGLESHSEVTEEQAQRKAMDRFKEREEKL